MTIFLLLIVCKKKKKLERQEHYSTIYYYFRGKSTKNKVVSGVKNIYKYPTLLLLANNNNKENLQISELNLGVSSYIAHLNYCYTGFQIDWVLLNVSSLVEKTKYYHLFLRFAKSKYVKFLNNTKNSLYNMYLQLAFIKSPVFLINRLQRLILSIPIKRHRSFFRKIREIIRFWYFLVLGIRAVKGYTIFFKGKLGRKGSVRKKKIFVKEGLTSFTNKSLRINYKNFILWTETGVVGANISIFF